MILSAFVFILMSVGNKTIRLSYIHKIIFLVISITCIMIEQMVLIAIINLPTTKGLSINIFISIFFLVFFLYFCLMVYIYNLGIEKEKEREINDRKFYF